MLVRNCPPLALLLLVGATYAQPARPPAPAEAAVTAAMKVVAEVYKKDVDAAKAPSQKRALAKKLLEDARETKDDPASKFALFTAARKMFLTAGDVDGAIQAVEALGASFAVEIAKQKLEVLTSLAPQAKSADDHTAVTRYIGRELPAMLKARRYDEAKALIDLAQSSAGKTRDADLVKQWKRREEWCASAARAWTEVAAAQTTLETKPSDPAANGVVGRFLCLFDEDWRQGAPMLALSDDPSLQPAAKREIAGVNATTDRLAIAEAWYDAYAQQPKDAPNKAALARQVAKLYRQSLSGLPVLTARRAENRLAELDAVASPFPLDEWCEILDLVDLAKHQLEGEWRREGLAVVMPTEQHCKAFRFPITIEGPYELRIRAMRNKGLDALSIQLSKSANLVTYALNGYHNQWSGVHCLHGKGADQNPSKTPAAPIRDNVPYVLTLQVEPKDDQISITALVDNKRYSRWVGPKSDLSVTHFRHETLNIGTCHAAITVFSVQLKMKSGAVRLTD